MPLADALAALGIELNLRAAEGNKDTGGRAGKNPKFADKTTVENKATAKSEDKADAAGDAQSRDPKDPPLPWLGARWTAGGEARLTHVMDDGPAQKAGLAAGDVILAWDGLKVTAGTLHTRVTRARSGERAEVHAFRRDELMTFAVVPEPAPLDTCWLSLSRDAPESAVHSRERWLSA